MAELKTQKTKASVAKFIAGIKDDQRREDCQAVLELMKTVTGEKPAIWGDGIVGFGSFHYKSVSGREGDWFPVGFASRKQHLVLYLQCGLSHEAALLEKLGKHKTGRSCLYLKKLDDVHLPTLKKLIKKAHKSPTFD